VTWELQKANVNLSRRPNDARTSEPDSAAKVRKKMNMGLFKRMRRTRIVIVLLALLLAYGAVSYSPRAETSLPTFSVGLGGVTGTTNNTVLAHGRYVLVAPFWPTKGVAENGDLELSELDNSFIYVIDTKKPDVAPLTKELTEWDSKLGAPKTVYFPTRLVFDSQSNNVYVRGTRFEEKDGEVYPVDVIAYVHLNLNDNGKPVFDQTVVAIDIQGVSTPFTGEAPLDFGFSANGELMVFTNGASVFSYNLDQGYLYGVGIVHPSDYSTDDNISFMDVDPTTNIVSICENRKSVGKDNVVSVSSAISFYRLREDGTFPLLKLVSSDQFPGGTALASGSNIAIVSDGDSEFAVFATNDGSLWTVDLQDGPVPATVKRLYYFPELARASDSDTSPLLIQYDLAKRTIGIVKPGFTAQISRPSNGKKGRISRPSNLQISSETPVLAMAKLGKKNKVVSASSFSEDFKGEGGLSNFVSGENSQWLISTYSGNLYSVDLASDLPDSTLTLVGQVGSRVERIAYYADRSNVVAVNSFTLEDDGMGVASPGSLVVGRISALESESGAVLQALLPTASMLGRSAPSIRRPCNIKR